MYVIVWIENKERKEGRKDGKRAKNINLNNNNNFYDIIIICAGEWIDNLLNILNGYLWEFTWYKIYCCNKHNKLLTWSIAKRYSRFEAKLWLHFEFYVNILIYQGVVHLLRYAEYQLFRYQPSLHFEWKKNLILLFDLLQNLWPPSPLKSERNK